MAALQWTDGSGAQAGIGADARDDIQVTLDGVNSTWCVQRGPVDVVVSIATARLGLLENGRGVLTTSRQSPGVASVAFDGDVVGLAATLHLAKPDTWMEGTLDVKASSSMGRQAVFSAR